MKKNNWIFSGIAIILVVGSFFIFAPSSHCAEKKMESTTCCKQKINGCPGKKADSGPGNLILDNLSRQFMSIVSFTY